MLKSRCTLTIASGELRSGEVFHLDWYWYNRSLHMLLHFVLQVLQAEALEQELLSVSAVSPLLTSPWGLPFFPAVLEQGFLLASRQLLSCVRAWTAASGSRQSNARSAATAAGAGGSSGGNGSQAPAAAAGLMADVCMQCAFVFTGCLRGLLASGAAAVTSSQSGSSGMFAEITDQRLEILECMTTSLLLLLQSLSAAGVKARTFGARKANASPAAKSAAAAAGASKLELEVALQDLMPALCGVAGASTALATAAASGQAWYRASAQRVVEVGAGLLQLLIVLCRDHLSAGSSIGYLRTHVRLLPLAQGALDRLEQELQQQAAVGRAAETVAGAAANGGRVALSAGAVLDISVFELMQVRSVACRPRNGKAKR